MGVVAAAPPSDLRYDDVLLSLCVEIVELLFWRSEQRKEFTSGERTPSELHHCAVRPDSCWRS